jgi:NADPH-dependent 7-cyano-7-deazaguanine reductase QueF
MIFFFWISQNKIYKKIKKHCHPSTMCVKVDYQYLESQDDEKVQKSEPINSSYEAQAQQKTRSPTMIVRS